MTIRDFLSASNGSVMVKIYVEDEVICALDSEYWSCLSDSILDCEFSNFEAKSVTNRKPEVAIYIATDDTEPDDTEPGEEEPDEEEP